MSLRSVSRTGLFQILLLIIFCTCCFLFANQLGTRNLYSDPHPSESVILKEPLHKVTRKALNQLTTSNNSIVIENRKQGTKIWWSAQSDKEPLIEGFTTEFCYNRSQRVVFKIAIDARLLRTSSFSSSFFSSVWNPSPSLSSNASSLPLSLKPITTIQLWIFRLGYYNGHGATLISNMSYAAINSDQPNCLFEISTRMVDCDNWKESLRWLVPKNAVSGVYIALPVVYVDGKEVRGGYIPFVIRQDSIVSNNVLFKTSDLTWVAYNRYGGYNLYRGNGTYTFDSRASKVSYNRPYQNRLYKPKGKILIEPTFLYMNIYI